MKKIIEDSAIIEAVKASMTYKQASQYLGGKISQQAIQKRAKKIKGLRLKNGRITCIYNR